MKKPSQSLVDEECHHLAYFYDAVKYDTLGRDEFSAVLMGLLYIQRHWSRFRGAVDGCLSPNDCNVLNQDVLSLRRSTLVRKRGHVLAALNSEKFSQRSVTSPKPSTGGRYRAKGQPSLGPPSFSELELLLNSIKSEAFIKDLLVPIHLPEWLTDRHKVEDSVEHARLFLLGVDVNIFFGCPFTYADLKLAANGDKRKLHDSMPLLRFMLQNPSISDKRFRGRFLDLHSQNDVEVINPIDYPLQVPDELQDDMSEKDLIIIRLYPIATRKGGKAYTIDLTLDEADVEYRLQGEPVAREMVCKAYHFLDNKVSPSAKDVYSTLMNMNGVVECSRLEPESRSVSRSVTTIQDEEERKSNSGCCSKPVVDEEELKRKSFVQEEEETRRCSKRSRSQSFPNQ